MGHRSVGKTGPAGAQSRASARGKVAGAASLASDDFAPLAMYRNTYVVKHTPRRNWSHRKVDGATNVVVHCKHGSDALLNGPLKSVQQAVSGEGRQQWRDATVLHPGSERGRTSPPVSSPRLAEELRSRGALSARMRREASSNSVGMEHGSSLRPSWGSRRQRRTRRTSSRSANSSNSEART